MIAVFLRHHATSRKGKGNIRVIITEEQWEHANRWTTSSKGEFEAPSGLWPFIVLKVRDVLDLGEFEPTPFLGRTLWRPKEDGLVPEDVPEIDLSELPIEVWHPDAPSAQRAAWPFPHPSFSDTA